MRSSDVPGFSGTNCDYASDACASATCPSGDTCVPKPSSPKGYLCQPTARVRLLTNLEIFADGEVARRLDAAPSGLQQAWERGDALPTVKPLLFSELPKNNTCTVYQKAQEYRSQVTLTVKCPKLDDYACTALVSVLDAKHRYADWEDLEAWSRQSCLATHVNATSEPIEEKMFSTCPSQRQMKKLWNQVGGVISQITWVVDKVVVWLCRLLERSGRRSTIKRTHQELKTFWGLHPVQFSANWRCFNGN